MHFLWINPGPYSLYSSWVIKKDGELITKVENNDSPNQDAYLHSLHLVTLTFADEGAFFVIKLFIFTSVSSNILSPAITILLKNKFLKSLSNWFIELNTSCE